MPQERRSDRKRHAKNKTAEKWQKVLDAMHSGEMPPKDEKQPPNAAKTDFLDDLSHAMVASKEFRAK